MKKNKIRTIKHSLIDSVKNVASRIHLFVGDPEKDFTRKRKLPPETLITLILSMGGGSLANELLDHFKCTLNTPSPSAFVQQRAKIKPDAFEELFRIFTRSAHFKRLWNGYRVIAADGSDICFSADESDIDSYYPEKKNQKSYNLLHLNAMYDLCENIYLDAVVQKLHNKNEHKAFVTMVDRHSDDVPSIFICDRGFESYNNMAHVQEKGDFFLIRIKDQSATGMASGFDLPQKDEFDITIDLSLTRKQTNEAKELCKDKNSYKFLSTNSTFDFLPKASRKCIEMKPYNLKFRIVRFKITDDIYETVVTNLDAEQFPPTELKELYNMRWGIETSFRALKYTIGLLYFHSKKADNVIQEIFARLTMYNYSELIISYVVIEQNNRKHDYKVNFAVAVHICRIYYLNNISPPDVEALISRHIIPIRKDRKQPRKMNNKTSVSFTYRIS